MENLPDSILIDLEERKSGGLIYRKETIRDLFFNRDTVNYREISPYDERTLFSRLYYESVKAFPSWFPYLTHLTLYDMFSANIDNLPDGLSYLKTGKNFKEPITKFPTRLKKLDMRESTSFNSSLNNLPQELEILILPDNFGKSFTLPKSLIELEF